jgi:Divergent InlB B-repeat domain
VSGYTFTNVTANHTLTATFRQAEYTLTVNVVGSGSVSRQPDQATYHYSDVMTLTARPAAGWTFAGWSGGLMGNPTHVTMAGNTVVTATFSQTPNPVPTLTSLSPTTVTVGGPDFVLTVTGTNFISSSVIQWNGLPLATTFVSSGRLTATVPASNIAASGTISITVVNPEPGGGQSNTLFLTVRGYKLYLPLVARNYVSGLAGQVTAGGDGMQIINNQDERGRR